MSDTPAPLFSEHVCEELRKKLAELADTVPEIQGIVTVVVYQPQLGDDIEPAMVLAGPTQDPVFITRAISLTCKFQQRLINRLEDAMRQGLASLQALRQDIDECSKTKQETAPEGKTQNPIAAGGSAITSGPA